MRISTEELDRLIENISNGDELAFKRLFTSYYDNLISFAFWYVKDRSVAEDVVADVFFNLWNRRVELVSVQYFETYLYSAVKNGCYNIINSGHSKRIARMEDANLDVCIDLETPLAKASYEQLRIAVENAINNLPKRCKLIFKMAKEDSLRYKEIGDVLGISSRTVETQIAIAVKKIEEELEPFLKELPTFRAKGSTLDSSLKQKILSLLFLLS